MNAKLHFTTDILLEDGTRERRFHLGDIPGILWTPGRNSTAGKPRTPNRAEAPANDPAAGPAPSQPSPEPPVPLVLLGHPGDVERMYPRLVGRAQASSAHGIATATLELPGTGTRTPMPEVDAARTELRTALAAGEPVSEDVKERLVLPLVDAAAPEWSRLLDALLDLPDIDGPVGYSGGIMGIGIRLAHTESRITAAGLFAGSYVPRVMFDEAHRITIPLHVLLQWDDEGNDRELALELFDAFGSVEKSLHANMGGHRGVPAHAGEGPQGFFARHLAART